MSDTGVPRLPTRFSGPSQFKSPSPWPTHRHHLSSLCSLFTTHTHTHTTHTRHTRYLEETRPGFLQLDELLLGHGLVQLAVD
jgi:hypothetical protein